MSSHRAFIIQAMEIEGAFIADDYLMGDDGFRCATVYSFLGEVLQINTMFITGVILYNDGRMVIHDALHDKLVELTT